MLDKPEDEAYPPTHKQYWNTTDSYLMGNVTPGDMRAIIQSQENASEGGGHYFSRGRVRVSGYICIRVCACVRVCACLYFGFPVLCARMHCPGEARLLMSSSKRWTGLVKCIHTHMHTRTDTWLQG
jgi:hypothetical protein